MKLKKIALSLIAACFACVAFLAAPAMANDLPLVKVTTNTLDLTDAQCTEPDEMVAFAMKDAKFDPAGGIYLMHNRAWFGIDLETIKVIQKGAERGAIARFKGGCMVSYREVPKSAMIDVIRPQRDFFTARR